MKHLEVDFVLEGRGGDVAGVSIKPSGSATLDDAQGLRFLRELAGDRFRKGVVLHPAERSYPLGADLWALPFSALWR